ncbi:MAG: hypothetical protein CMC37_03080 [Flavobacteriaceae bacterium]|nr:hypothetical protein [Flavobacteriaceae bacterium]
MNAFIAVLLVFFAGVLIFCYGLWEDSDYSTTYSSSIGESDFRTYGKFVMTGALIILLIVIVVSK